MKRTMFTTVIATLAVVLMAPVFAHNTFTTQYAPAGYLQDLEMRVTHGCKGSPVNSVRIKIPEGVYRVTVNNSRDWSVEIKMRKLAKPVPGDGGNMMTETADEVIWSNPKSTIPAMGYFEGFKFRASLPKEPGQILFFKTINGCVAGDDKYVDLPATPLDLKGKDFPQKLLAFMSATPGPSPFLILEKPLRPQYPWASPEPPKSAPKR